MPAARTENREPGTGNPSFRLKAIAAMASNRVIGRDGDIPWRLPGDWKWFKKCTMGHPILMGRKTFASLPGMLPGRRHIVLSRSLRESPEGVDLIAGVDQLGTLGLEGDVFVIGGAAIYELLLPRCDDLYLSYVFAPHEGDTCFPPFEDDFELVEVMEKFPEFEVRHYRRIGSP